MFKSSTKKLTNLRMGNICFQTQKDVFLTKKISYVYQKGLENNIQGFRIFVKIFHFNLS